MKPRAVLAALIAIALLAPAAAADQSTAEALDRLVKSNLHSCFKRAEQDTAKDNLLVAPGLKNCYYQASQAWQAATSRLKGRLGTDSNSPCGRVIEAIEEEWNTYSERVLSLESLQGMALNTDDDLELAMRKHLYELAYALSVNTDCPK